MAGTKRTKIKKSDQVVIIAGRDKGKRGRVIAERSHKSLGCLSHRFIVVYDRNQEGSAQVGAPWSFLISDDLRPVPPPAPLVAARESNIRDGQGYYTLV